MAGLTTHILDTMHGCPAAGVALRLFLREESGRLVPLRAARTNADGRVDTPLLAADEIAIGRYRLEFDAGAYFRDRGVTLPAPAFLDVVAIEFGISDIAAHHHVPLLLSPYGYSTYRGS